MSYVRITAKRDDGLEVEFELDSFPRNDPRGDIVATLIDRAAEKAKAAIISKVPEAP